MLVGKATGNQLFTLVNIVKEATYATLLEDFLCYTGIAGATDVAGRCVWAFSFAEEGFHGTWFADAQVDGFDNGVVVGNLQLTIYMYAGAALSPRVAHRPKVLVGV